MDNLVGLRRREGPGTAPHLARAFISRPAVFISKAPAYSSKTSFLL